MRNRNQALLISGLLAATAMALLLLLVPRGPATPLAQPEPQTPVAQDPQPSTQPAAEPRPGTKTYANAKHGFSVTYPDAILETEDASDMQLSGYIPVCDPDVAAVCFPLPKETYPGTNFTAAAFAVHLRDDLTARASCEKAAGGEEADGEATINGTIFKKFSFGDAATSHRLEGENYRAFKNGRCYELSTRVATTVFEVYEPGTITPFTDENRSALQATLDAMLMSFRFNGGS